MGRELLFWYANRTDWEQGKAQCAEIREYDDQGRLSNVKSVSLEDADRLSAGRESEEIEDPAVRPYSVVNLDDEIGPKMVHKQQNGSLTFRSEADMRAAKRLLKGARVRFPGVIQEWKSGNGVWRLGFPGTSQLTVRAYWENALDTAGVEKAANPAPNPSRLPRPSLIGTIADAYFPFDAMEQTVKGAVEDVRRLGNPEQIEVAGWQVTVHWPAPYLYISLPDEDEQKADEKPFVYHAEKLEHAINRNRHPVYWGGHLVLERTANGDYRLLREYSAKKVVKKHR